MRRLIAGFLFAVVIIVIGHFGAWLLAANHAQNEVIATLEGIPNLDVSYKRIIPKGYPNQVRLDVRDLNIVWRAAQDDKTISITIPQVSIQTPLFDMRKALVDFNQEFTMDLQHNSKLLRTFRVVSEGARFSSFIRPDGTTEHALNVSNLTLWDQKAQKGTSPVLRTGIGYLVREVPGVRAPVSWRVSVQDVRATNKLVGQAFDLNRLVAVVGFEEDFFSTYGAGLLPVFSTTQTERQQAKQKLAHELTKNPLLPHIMIDSMQIEKDENWVSLRGSFGLSNQQYLDGRLSLNANNLEPVVNFITSMGLIKTKSQQDTQKIVQAIKGFSDNGNMNIMFERDRAYINSEHVTRTPTLKELLAPGK